MNNCQELIVTRTLYSFTHIYMDPNKDIHTHTYILLKHTILAHHKEARMQVHIITTHTYNCAYIDTIYMHA